jgi:hypothetical protein
MFSGMMIDELIETVQQAEVQARAVTASEPAVKVTRYEVAPGVVYAMLFPETQTRVGAA